MHALSRIIRNQVGGGLLMGSLAVGALGAAGMILGDMFIKNDEVLRKDSRTEAYRHLVESVRQNLYAGNNCTIALGNAPGLGVGAKEVTQGLGNFLGINGAAGQKINLKLDLTERGIATELKEGAKIKTGTSIKEIYIQKEKDANGGKVVRLHSDLNSKILKAAYFNIIIEPDHKGINVWDKHKVAPPGKSIYKNEDVFIRIFAYYDPFDGNKIYSCFDPSSDAAFCTEAQGGAFDHRPTTPARLRCQPDQTCFQAKGGIVPTSVTCDPPYVSTPIGRGALGAQSLHICSWCPESPRSDFDSLVGQTLTNDLGDFDGDVCGATGYNGAQQDSYYYQQAWGGDGGMFNVGAVDDPNLAGGLNNCLSAQVQCADDQRLPPNGDPLATGPFDGMEGGLDGNRCMTDCSPSTPRTDHAGGCNNGQPCNFDRPETQCDNECTGGRHVVWQGCDDICTAENECPPPPAETTGGSSSGSSGGSSGGGPPTCFIAGTKILMQNGSEKNIEDVLAGEFVLTSKSSDRVEKAMVHDFNGHIYGINGGRPFFTPNHPFMTVEGWKSLDPQASMIHMKGEKVTLLREGDILITRNGVEALYVLNSEPYDGKVYNITVGNSHEYYADEYRVHNKMMDNCGEIRDGGQPYLRRENEHCN